MKDMVEPLQDLDLVRDYYCQRRMVDGRPMNIYEIWEKGGAFNDSVTPSTYSPEYRSHITLKLLSLTSEADVVFSIGCGNGFVEAEVLQCNRKVLAIDCNEEAVRLAAGKGIEASQTDFYDLSPHALSHVDLVYADGLLGHLFRHGSGLAHFTDKLRALSLRNGTRLVFSNDSPRDPELAFSPHDRLRDFWFLSRTYLAQVMAEAGFGVVESYYFPYVRPLSGLRNRTICIAQVR
jgi:SAM-dependent methyltransferase